MNFKLNFKLNEMLLNDDYVNEMGIQLPYKYIKFNEEKLKIPSVNIKDYLRHQSRYLNEYPCIHPNPNANPHLDNRDIKVLWRNERIAIHNARERMKKKAQFNPSDLPLCDALVHEINGYLGRPYIEQLKNQFWTVYYGSSYNREGLYRGKYLKPLCSKEKEHEYEGYISKIQTDMIEVKRNLVSNNVIARLKKMCKENGIKGYSKLKRKELMIEIMKI